IENIQSLHNFYLIHFTETKDNRDETGTVRPESIVRVTDNLRDFSNFLLGTFQVDDIYLEFVKGQFKDYFGADWVIGSAINPVPQIDRDFVLNKSRGFFFLLIGDCDGYHVNYTDDGSNVNATCQVLHTP